MPRLFLPGSIKPASGNTAGFNQPDARATRRCRCDRGSSRPWTCRSCCPGAPKNAITATTEPACVQSSARWPRFRSGADHLPQEDAERKVGTTHRQVAENLTATTDSPYSPRRQSGRFLIFFALFDGDSNSREEIDRSQPNKEGDRSVRQADCAAGEDHRRTSASVKDVRRQTDRCAIRLLPADLGTGLDPLFSWIRAHDDHSAAGGPEPVPALPSSPYTESSPCGRS